MIEFINAISIGKLEKVREIKLATSFIPSNPLLKDINTFSYKSTEEIVSGLEKALDGEYKYEWAGMRTSFESNSSFTLIQDMIFNLPEIKIESKLLLNLMKERKKFMEQIKISNLIELIIENFEKIQDNPSKYESKESPSWYIILHDNIEINYCLLKSDFTLSKKNFSNTLRLNQNYYCK